MTTTKKTAGLLHCSFCGKHQKQLRKLIAGPGVYICNECIDLCNQIIDEENSPGGAETISQPPSEASIDDLLSVLGQNSRALVPIEDHIRDCVKELRSRSVTWAQIGEALGVTRQAAWDRYSGEE